MVIDYKKFPFEKYGYPDGMCVDNDGKIWIANIGPGVTQIDPITGF